MKTICFCNQKGGCAKSTSAYAMAVGLRDRGYRVLVIDADPQGDLSYTAGYDDVEPTLYDVLKKTCSVSEALRTSNGLDLLSVGIEATAADMELASRTGREYLLKRVMDEISVNYDIAVIDTHPSLALLTLNALTAADYVIVPMDMEIYSIRGMRQLGEFIKTIKEETTNKSLKISGLLLVRYKERLNVTQALKDRITEAAKELKTKVFKTTIRESVAIKETQILQTDIFSDAPRATATKDYAAFIDEFLEREKLKKGVKKNGNKK